MDNDTDLGGRAAAFPATHCSLLRDAASKDATVRKRACDALISAYWKPVYKYIRVKWGSTNEDAKDLTQGFFARALEKEFFEQFDPAKARFRTFVRICVDGFVANERRAAAAVKRGGQTELVALDFDVADRELRLQGPPNADLDDYFRQEWVRALFTAAVEDLRHQCAAAGHSLHFTLFERYDLDGTEQTYAQLGDELGLSAVVVTNYLASARRQFRELVLSHLRAATGSEEEFQEEAAALFGGKQR